MLGVSAPPNLALTKTRRLPKSGSYRDPTRPPGEVVGRGRPLSLALVAFLKLQAEG